MGQKIPLFGGVITEVPADASVVPVFTPPDKTSKVPGTYELHLFMVVDPLQQILLQAHEGTKPAVPVWQGYTDPLCGHSPIVKALDGYVVRGDVTVEILVNNKGGGNPLYVWGYYHRTGQGPQIQPERRAIGANLNSFNAGVPISIPTESDAIVHYFEENRLDELSLAFVFPSDVVGDADVRIGFEDENDTEIGFGLIQPRTGSVFANAVGVGPAPSVALPPFGSLFSPSQYSILQCPFGGDKTIHHIRVGNTHDTSALSVHGYFTRR